MSRRPLAVSNWKMAKSIDQSQSFVRDLRIFVGNLMEMVDIVICPPYTALWRVAQATANSTLQLGAQNMAPTAELACTGQISAALLSDVGCQWVLLGHWEVRRLLGDDDQAVQDKIRLALDTGLQPIIAIGESSGEVGTPEAVIGSLLERLLAGFKPEELNEMAFMYEPEAAIGVLEPAAADRVSEGCQIIRRFLDRAGETAGARIIYGGSVTPDHATLLLKSPYVDGLAASRQGRDPAKFAEIVRQIAEAKLN